MPTSQGWQMRTWPAGWQRLLAAVRLHAEGRPASALLLACPNADMTLSEPSVLQEGHGWGLAADDLRWFVLLRRGFPPVGLAGAKLRHE
jgi:hypothetical protein